MPTPPAPFADLTLARRLERTEGRACAGIVETRGRLDPESGATVLEVAGALAMFDGTESPLTQSFGLGIFDPVEDDHLDRLESFYRERSAPVDVEICPLAGFELTERLVARGYRPIEMSNVLYQSLAAEAVEEDLDAGVRAAAKAGLRVRLVATDEHEIWAATAARGWSDFGDVLEMLQVLARINARRDDAHAFLVEQNGAPIATGGLFVSDDGTALLAGASTVPEARRRGAQRALHAHRLQFARERGCDLVMMGAEPGTASQRNAERNGFRVAYSRTKWRLEP